MADNVTVAAGTFATDDIGGLQHQRIKLVLGADGVSDGDVSSANPMPVTGALTDAQLRAVAVPVSGTFYQATQPVSGPITDAQLRATPVQVYTQPNPPAATTGTITANAQTVFADCTRFSNLTVYCTGTFSTVNVTFEGSLNSTNGTDGNWFGIQAVRTNANTIELTTGNLSAAPAYAWELSVNGLKYFRVRATAYTSGTQTWTFLPGTYATEPIPAAQISGTQPVSGTVTATVTGGTVLPVTPTTTFTNSAATTNATNIKASAGTVWSIVASNINAAARYLKVYNLAAAPTVGTSVPVFTLKIPADDVIRLDGGPNGIRFATGIAIALTTENTDAGTTAVAANEIKIATTFT